jgi:hypothetical protein
LAYITLDQPALPCEDSVVTPCPVWLPGLQAVIRSQCSILGLFFSTLESHWEQKRNLHPAETTQKCRVSPAGAVLEACQPDQVAWPGGELTVFWKQEVNFLKPESPLLTTPLLPPPQGRDAGCPKQSTCLLGCPWYQKASGLDFVVISQKGGAKGDNTAFLVWE